MYHGRRVEAIVDVWCEAPVRKTQWREIADSALTPEQRENDWGGIEYLFVMGEFDDTFMGAWLTVILQVYIRKLYCGIE